MLAEKRRDVALVGRSHSPKQWTDLTSNGGQNAAMFPFPYPACRTPCAANDGTPLAYPPDERPITETFVRLM